jgi:hypothetical protein
MLIKPPEPEPYDYVFASPYVELEALRQIDLFYPYMGQKRSKDVLKVYIAGIFTALDHGQAKILDPEGDIVFWNPVSGEWVEYDRDYNEIMMMIMNTIKESFNV